MRILTVPNETGQQHTAEMPDEFQAQAHVNKYRTGLRRIKGTWLPPTSMVNLSVRSEREQENISGVDWLYTSIGKAGRFLAAALALECPILTNGHRRCRR